MNAIILVFIGMGFLLLLLIGFLVSWLSWNIPITILRFTGNKQRPMLLHKKGRKRMSRGVPFLQVRGYKGHFRDFKSGFYWPGYRTKYGALILWEFEDGKLTPVIPKKKDVPKEKQLLIEAGIAALAEIQNVEFEYSPEMHAKLMLKVVDDVDTEFMVEELAREGKQYTGGLWAFLDRYGTHLVWIIMAICALTAYIIYLDKAPNLGAQCLSQLGEVVREDFLSKMAGAAAPPG